MTTPTSHLVQAEKLTADALIDLYEIQITDPVAYVRFTNQPTLTWQGNTFEFLPCIMSGDKKSTDGQQSRPGLKIVNPEGLFNPFVFAGKLDKARVIRKRVLKEHVETNTNIFEQRLWYISRVKSIVAGQFIEFELRMMTDGAAFQIPARMYTPDQGFPVVNI